MLAFQFKTPRTKPRTSPCGQGLTSLVSITVCLASHNPRYTDANVEKRRQRAVVRHLPLPATQCLKTRVRSVFSGR